MDHLQQQYLHAMGIQVWKPRDAGFVVDDPVLQSEPESEPLPEPVITPEVTPVPMPVAEPAADLATPPGEMGWETLEQAVAACRKCGLDQSRTNTVFGVGDRNASIMIVGEAPGADEDRQGEPFVGRAGQLLTEILYSIGYRREDVFIANILKCRPPGNRNPEPDEVGCCEPWLQRQIELVKPDMIVAVGGVAAQNLLKTDQPVGALRGQPLSYADTGIPVIVTYHPAYLLRSPSEKRKVWQDLCSLYRGGQGAVS